MKVCLTKITEIIKIHHNFHCCSYISILTPIYSFRLMNHQSIWLKRPFIDPFSQCFYMPIEGRSQKITKNLIKISRSSKILVHCQQVWPQTWWTPRMAFGASIYVWTCENDQRKLDKLLYESISVTLHKGSELGRSKYSCIQKKLEYVRVSCLKSCHHKICVILQTFLWIKKHSSATYIKSRLKWSPCFHCLRGPHR